MQFLFHKHDFDIILIRCIHSYTEFFKIWYSILGEKVLKYYFFRDYNYLIILNCKLYYNNIIISINYFKMFLESNVILIFCMGFKLFFTICM